MQFTYVTTRLYLYQPSSFQIWSLQGRFKSWEAWLCCRGQRRSRHPMARGMQAAKGWCNCCKGKGFSQLRLQWEDQREVTFLEWAERWGLKLSARLQNGGYTTMWILEQVWFPAEFLNTSATSAHHFSLIYFVRIDLVGWNQLMGRLQACRVKSVNSQKKRA